ncbi:MAG: hypothetical protein KIT09_30830 [Bryobacteraceae bacterium]|nr:hypothetical protein [Bryobacteraceae bacterium]
MRTTLNIDDDVYELARSLADGQSISLGEAVSYLARRGAFAPPDVVVEDGFPMFRVDPGAPPFGPEDIDAAQDGEDRDWAPQFPTPRR